MSYLGVIEAAGKLGVSPRRIRQLIDSGELDARRIGRSWLLDAGSVEGRLRASGGSGRPLAPKNAWRLALLAEGSEDDELSASERWRMRGALKLLLEGADLPSIDRKLRARSDRIEPRFAHPSVLGRLAEDGALVVSGQRAASELGSDLVPDERLEAYVREEDLARVEKRYRLQPAESQDANVVLQVLRGPDVAWKQHVAPRLFVAADLSRSFDARAKRAAEKLLLSIRG